MEEAVLATLKGLEEVVDVREEPPIFFEDKQGTLVVLGLNFGVRGGGEGSGGSGGRDEPTDSDPEPSDSEGEEEDEEDQEDEEMANANIEWMNWGPLALTDALHKMPKRAERVNIKFNPDSAVKAEDYLDKFYLQLQTLEVHYDDVACRLFPYTLDDQVAAWYHNLPPNSIQNWGYFKRMFLEKFSDEQTPAMLLKELGSLKMEGKEKVKDFNQRFTRILNKFAVDTKPRGSITVDYYTSTLPSTIAQFIKWAAKPTLLESYEEAIAIEKDLRAIVVIKDDKSMKDSKHVSKKPQETPSKGRDKETIDIETLTRLVKNLTTEMSELKQQKIDKFVNNHLPR